MLEERSRAVDGAAQIGQSAYGHGPTGLREERQKS
jgi:hypothetical protein